MADIKGDGIDWAAVERYEKARHTATPAAAPIATTSAAPGQPIGQQRMYAAAIPNRFNQGFPSYNLSADAEMVTSLRNLRSRSRQLVRDAAYAKACKRAIVNNVVGTGIKLQPTIMNSRNAYNKRLNDAVRDSWEEWCHAPNCHTGGVLHFHDLERQAMGQVFEAGEIFLRIWRQPFGHQGIPLALEIVEPERIADGYAQPGGAHWENLIRMGIEVDEFKRPVAYWIRDLHPGDIRLNVDRTDHYTRVPAADIFHLKITDRWPQTRGEPWMHAVASKVADIDGYTEAEIIAARGAASYMATIETPEAADVVAQRAADQSLQFQLEPGTTFKLNPGEKLNFISPNRPNSAMESFVRLMLREMGVGIGASYQTISGDYSQSNYSSSRLALLDERDVWRSLQMWFIRSFRHRLHKEWIQAAILSKNIEGVDLQDYALNLKKYETALFRPRGWQWVDPTKEVGAYKEAVKAGFITVGQVIAQTAGGDDLEDILETRTAELEYMAELKLVFDTSPSVYVAAESRGQVLIGDDGLPEPAAAVTAQALDDAGLTAPGAAPSGAEPGVQAPANAQGGKPKPAAPADDDANPDANVNADDDEAGDRSVRRFKLLNFLRRSGS